MGCSETARIPTFEISFPLGLGHWAVRQPGTVLLQSGVPAGRIGLESCRINYRYLAIDCLIQIRDFGSSSDFRIRDFQISIIADQWTKIGFWIVFRQSVH